MITVSCDDSIRTFVFNNGGKENFPFFTIGKNSYINDMKIQVNMGNEVINIHIGNYCSIAYNVTLLIDRNHDYKSISTSPLLEVTRKLPKKGQIIIGNDVWIGNDVTILSGVRIGDGAVVGAGTIVTKDIPPYAIAIGNPMKIIKYRFDKEQIKQLLEIKWWNWGTEEIEENKMWFGKDIQEFVSKFNTYRDTEVQSIVMEKKLNSILFIPDFNEPYPIWRNVINQYISHFSSYDEVTLILRIEQDENFEENINNVINLISERADYPDILIINDIISNEKMLFKDINYFITTRNQKTIEYIEYADEFNVNIISGVDVPVFTDYLKEQILEGNNR
ncbi:acetyltransferase [Bacillus sp. 7586-K]|nr:acetyltransferase [Bacillus sp. 7586-K]